MAGAFPFIIQTVLCKLNGEAVIWGLVEACYEAFHELPCEELKASILGNLVQLDSHK